MKMENKTPGLTKLIVIFEPLLLAASLIAFYFLRGKMALPGILWLWAALIIFSAASFLFFLVVFIIALSKKSLRATYWAPFLIVPCITFLVLALLMFVGPSVMQPQFIETPVEEVEAVTSTTAEVEKVETQTTILSEETEEKAETNIFEIGDTFKIGDLQFTINSVRTSETDKYSMEPSEEDYIFLFIDTTIENLGSKSIDIYPPDNFRLVDKNGRNYNFGWAEGKGNIQGTLAPERKISGELGYGIPKDINEYELEVSNRGLFGSEVAIVRISISQ